MRTGLLYETDRRASPCSLRRYRQHGGSGSGSATVLRVARCVLHGCCVATYAARLQPRLLCRNAVGRRPLSAAGTPRKAQRLTCNMQHVIWHVRDGGSVGSNAGIAIELAGYATHGAGSLRQHVQLPPCTVRTGMPQPARDRHAACTCNVTAGSRNGIHGDTGAY
jgi:hypothetical protein